MTHDAMIHASVSSHSNEKAGGNLHEIVRKEIETQNKASAG